MLRNPSPPMEHLRVDATTILRGDRVYLCGREWQIADMCTVSGGRKRLVLDNGGMVLLDPGRILDARRPLPAT